MFKSSLRNVARSCPAAHSTSSRPSLSTQITASFSSRTHQRRHSSSKPPVPPSDGSHNIAAPTVKTVGTPRTKNADSVKTVGTPRSKDAEDKRSGADGRVSRRKLTRDKGEPKQEAKDDWTLNMPSVPSTQYRDPKDVSLASFFSLHRPMSVSASIPPQASLDVVDAIFAPKKQSLRQRPGPEEVIYTLASALEGLEGNISQQQNGQQQQGVAQRADIIAALTRHNDLATDPSDPNQPHHLDGEQGQQSARAQNGVKLVIQEMARRFRPFKAPPAPVPISDAEIEAREASIAAADSGEEMQALQLEQQIESQDQTTGIRQVVLTLHQNGDLQSRKFFTPHQAPIIKNVDSPSEQQIQQVRDILKTHEVPRHGRLRRGERETQHERLVRRQKIYAISVKRQRRLKMKKHKYKKLMKKTRNLRRRMDKL